MAQNKTLDGKHADKIGGDWENCRKTLSSIVLLDCASSFLSIADGSPEFIKSTRGNSETKALIKHLFSRDALRLLFLAET